MRLYAQTAMLPSWKRNDYAVAHEKLCGGGFGLTVSRWNSWHWSPTRAALGPTPAPTTRSTNLDRPGRKPSVTAIGRCSIFGLATCTSSCCRDPGLQSGQLMPQAGDLGMDLLERGLLRTRSFNGRVNSETYWDRRLRHVYTWAVDAHGRHGRLGASGRLRLRGRRTSELLEDLLERLGI